MSIRTKVLGMVDVMMRVPPIMVIDQLFKAGLGLPMGFSAESGFSSTTDNSETGIIRDDTAKFGNGAVEGHFKNEGQSSSMDSFIEIMNQDSEIIYLIRVAALNFLIYAFGLIAAACIFVLWTRHLVMVYMFGLSVFITYLSYWSNMSAVTLLQQSNCTVVENLLSFNRTRILDTGTLAISIAPHLLAQWFLGILFAYMHLGPRCTILQRPMPLIFISPILLALLPLPSQVLLFAPLATKLVPMLLIILTAFNSFIEVAKTLYNGYVYSANFVANFGYSALLENEWQRLNVPNVLRVFWTMR